MWIYIFFTLTLSYVIVKTFIEKKKKQDTCTVPISASVINIEREYHRNGKHSSYYRYTVDFKFDYMGSTITNTYVTDEQYEFIYRFFECGELMDFDIYINPDNPMEFYYKEEPETNKRMLKTLGVVILIFCFMTFLEHK